MRRRAGLRHRVRRLHDARPGAAQVLRRRRGGAGDGVQRAGVARRVHDVAVRHFPLSGAAACVARLPAGGGGECGGGLAFRTILHSTLKTFHLVGALISGSHKI